MIEDKIVEQFINDYGIDKTIAFAEMSHLMFQSMHEDLEERRLSSSNVVIWEMADERDYLFYSTWWKNKYEELQKIRNGIKEDNQRCL